MNNTTTITLEARANAYVHRDRAYIRSIIANAYIGIDTDDDSDYVDSLVDHVTYLYIERHGTPLSLDYGDECDGAGLVSRECEAEIADAIRPLVQNYVNDRAIA